MGNFWMDQVLAEEIADNLADYLWLVFKNMVVDQSLREITKKAYEWMTDQSLDQKYISTTVIYAQGNNPTDLDGDPIPGQLVIDALWVKCFGHTSTRK